MEVTENENLKIKEISQDVIEVLVGLTRGVIGYSIGTVMLRELNLEENPNGREILYRFAGTIEDTLGKNGAFATLRQVGRDLAQKLMDENPEEEWKGLFNNALREFGFAQEIKDTENEAFICSCVFYDMLQENNKAPTEHPICWTSWGFIEGFMRVFKDVKRIQWAGRDIEAKRCKFDFIGKDNQKMNN